MINPRLVELRQYVNFCAIYWGFSTKNFLSYGRDSSLTRPRKISMAAAASILRSPKASLKEIGKAFGGRNHGTVIHARRMLEPDYAFDWRDNLDEAEKLIDAWEEERTRTSPNKRKELAKRICANLLGNHGSMGLIENREVALMKTKSEIISSIEEVLCE